ncbi:SHOCT domain-containing protein [Saccharopolyspora phatthalungensis]|uniref:Putative membrane protein n=1 Tax=Saccharopolyspora phatthalungensis TaxID=664693 RepID=A0A840QA27_9PSEU|nr:SHOCT domain-containing protein [Saccharopolyspora phatthalungensis]MBB5157634.1 putative membrane protein [Saccharopolyspora phatthalungensis]
MLTEFLTQWGPNPGWHGPPWGPGWPIGLFFVLVVVALVATVIWLAVRGRPRQPSAVERAREILAERFARGELSPDEYRERLHELG